MSAENKKAVMKEITDLLASGESQMAQAKIKEKNLTSMDVTEAANAALRECLKEKRYVDAIALCEEFNLPVEQKIDIINLQFRTLAAAKQFQEAYDWGEKYGLSKNDLNTNALAAFESALDKDDIQTALHYIDTMHIPLDVVVGIARASFNQLFDNKQYRKAFLLGYRFEISRKRTLTAGIRGYNYLLGNGDIKTFLSIEKDYKVLTDRDLKELEPEDTDLFKKRFIDNVVQHYFDENKIEELFTVLESLEILKVYEVNKLAGDLRREIMNAAADKHNEYIVDGRGPAAFELVEKFFLLSDEAPRDVKVEIIKTVENAHHELLNKGNLSGAVFLKENYRLFSENVLENSMERLEKVSADFLANTLEKGSPEVVKTFIRDYKISQEIISDASTEAVRNQLEKGHYDEVFAIIRTLNADIADSDILHDAASHFHRIYEGGNIELAADIAFYFRLREGRVPKAYLTTWQTLMDEGKTKEALKYRKERHIEKRLLEPVLKTKYQELMNAGKTDDAIRLRRDYRFGITILQFIMENIRRLIGG